MKLGAEPKKIAILAGLLLVAGYLLLSGDSEEGPPSSQRAAAVPAPTPAATQTAARPPMVPAAEPAARRRSLRGGQEFRPSLRPRREEDRPDPMTIDPTLRLDLLAKLQDVRTDDVKRSIFEFGRPPAPKVVEPKISPAEMEQIRERQKLAAAEVATAANKKAPPPPISLKYYGYISPSSSTLKRAFFLDGEDIFVATEGDIVKKRYKIVKIGVNSAVVEDTQHDHEQTLKLEEARG
jgi:hypothetical protein